MVYKEILTIERNITCRVCGSHDVSKNGDLIELALEFLRACLIICSSHQVGVHSSSVKRKKVK